MRKFLLAAIALLILTAQVEAAGLTGEQLDKAFAHAKQGENNAPLYLNDEDFQDRFNWLIAPIIQDGMGIDDASAMEYFFLVKDYDVTETANGTIYAYVFGYNGVAVVGLSAANDDAFKVLSLCYKTPENADESVFTGWLMKAFVGSITPDVDVQALIKDLTTGNSSGGIVKNGVRYSVAEDGNLNILTAVAAQ